MRKRILNREPWRGGQICGYQISYGSGPSQFCGYRKAQGEYFCRVHARSYRLGGETLRMAAGNALGDLSLPVVLSWEPWDGDQPIPATMAEFLEWAFGLDLRTLKSVSL